MSDLDPTLPASAGAVAASSGARIGRFSTIGTLGSGGMGVVLEAHDPELDRRVAIKLLHRGIGVVQLRREAQAMAKLSHPNVVAVYEVGTLEDQVFVAMELVLGQTLRAWMKEPHSWREKIEMLLGVGRGLAAVHEAGLTHRDIKPENILVGKDGRPRVTDFGLVPGAGIGEDSVAGTPSYMAPEQWAGESDPRSDQFSFCVVAWEALFGRRPYNDVRSDEAIVAPTAGDVPRGIEQALRRGLAGDPDERWPDMTALLAALEEAARPRRRMPWIVGGALALTVVGAVVVLAVRGGGKQDEVPSLAVVPDSIRRLTFDDACDEYPSFAPDGKTVYYDSTVGSDVRLFTVDVGGGTPREVAPTAGMDLAPKVSPDGSRIAFLRATADLNMSLFVAPLPHLDRGKPFAVTGGRPFWSPDGAHVWSGWLEGTVRYDAATGAKGRTLKPTEGHMAVQGIELADGRVVVLNAPLDGSALGISVVLYPAGDGPPVKLYEAQMWDVLALHPDGEAVVVSLRNANHTIDLVRVPLDGSPASVVTRGTILARSHLAFAGERIVWSDCFSRVGLATLGENGFTDLSRSDWSDNSVTAAPGSSRYYFVSDRGETFTVYSADRKSPESAARVDLGAHSPGQIAISHDGRSIAFVDRRTGLMVAPLDGSSKPRTLAPDTIDVYPVFDRHGTTIYFNRAEGKKIRVMAVPVAGGEPTQVLDHKSHAVAASPTADVLAYLTPEEPDGAAPMLLDLKTGTKRKLFPPERRGRWDRLRWSADGTRILVVNTAAEIVEVEVATGRELRRWPTAPDMIMGVAYVGEELVVSRAHWTGDVWTAKLAE